MPGQKLNLPPMGPVCGKVRHYSRDEAEKHLETLKRRKQASRSAGADALAIYWCRECQAYHVGHRAQ
jgi:hypothetical protein